MSAPMNGSDGQALHENQRRCAAGASSDHKDTTMSDEFNLHKLIREVISTSDVADPGVLAQEVSQRISPSQVRTALNQVLPSIVKQALALHRAPMVLPERASRATGGSQMRESHGGGAVGNVVPARSRKVQGIREAWQQMLRDRINVGPDTGDWKFLADCTVDDLSYAARLREDHARRNAEKAAQFRRLAELLEDQGVETVGDLPTTILSETLADAA